MQCGIYENFGIKWLTLFSNFPLCNIYISEWTPLRIWVRWATAKNHQLASPFKMLIPVGISSFDVFFPLWTNAAYGSRPQTIRKCFEILFSLQGSTDERKAHEKRQQMFTRLTHFAEFQKWRVPKACTLLNRGKLFIYLTSLLKVLFTRVCYESTS